MIEQQSFLFMKNVLALCLTFFFALRCAWEQNHWGCCGEAKLHQVSGLPPVQRLTLLWRHPDTPAVGGVCCPLLETVSYCSFVAVAPLSMQ